MDPTRFDTLTRSFCNLTGRVPSRRELLQAFSASLLGLGALGTAEHSGKAKQGRKRRRRKRKQLCLFGRRRCRDKRCHGCCSDADCGGNVCQSGTCSDCPRNEQLCRGGCIPEEACCTDAACTGGRVCTDGACSCRPGERVCEEVCIAADACCGTDCPVGSCSPENCSGCCDGTTCREGDSQNFCGRDGMACTRCGRDAVCNAGACDCPSGSEMCPNGDCIPLGGCCANADCMACQTCESGTCVDTCPNGLECVVDVCRCTTTSCIGCCQDNVCESGVADDMCGASGEACHSCLPNGECFGGACFCPEGPPFCNGVCCGAENTCCSATSPEPCCPSFMSCCPQSAPNSCCQDVSFCFNPDDPRCFPVSAVTRTTSSSMTMRQRKRQKSSRRRRPKR